MDDTYDDNVVVEEDPIIDDVGSEDVTLPPPLPESGPTPKQIIFTVQAIVVIVIILIIIIVFVCRPKKKKDDKKIEDTNYPSVEQVCEETKQTRSQVTLRKTAGGHSVDQ